MISRALRHFASQVLAKRIFTVFSAMSLAGCVTVEPDPVRPAEAPRASAPGPGQVTSSPVADTTFADDTLLLAALLEGWNGNDAELSSDMGELFFESIRATFPDLPESQWALLVREYTPRIVNLCRANLTTVFITYFSHEDLREIIRFYKTPVGRAYARAYPQIILNLARDPLRDALRREIVTRIRMEQIESRTSKP